ncbi:MAG: hypothetical protein ACK4UN_17430, partial [Limisphaerales bacterium]
AVAQYTNTFAYTSGNIMIGYNDTYDSIGSTNNFVIFDNVRVERIFPTAVKLQSPRVSGNNFIFSFSSDPGATYTVLRTTSPGQAPWVEQSTVLGSGGVMNISVPLQTISEGYYFRVARR